ncbi:MAG: LysE family translocator [Blastocatellia bacterium]
MSDSQLLAFTGIAALLTITPGADTMLVLRNVLARGQAAGLLTTLGICAGLFIHATLSACGLSLILLRSPAAFATVKLAGAGYLVWLGLQSLWQVARARPDEFSGLRENAAVNERAGAGRSLLEGLLTNVLNPKVAVFYLAFLPQFINPRGSVVGQSLLLTGIHCAQGLIWLSLLTVFLQRLRATLLQPRIRRRLEGLAGATLIAFGVRLALFAK